MEHEPEAFPNDENGDVLRRMHAHGDNLAIARTIDFAVIFPTESAALECATILLKSGEKVRFSAYPENTLYLWQVEVYPVMVPTHDAITRFEHMLEALAVPLGGRNDGWGSPSQGC